MIELLKASIQDALSENSSSSSNAAISLIGETELNDHLRHLSQQIDDKSIEIAANISTILDTFDLALSLPPAPLDLAHLNELLLNDNDEAISPSMQFDGAVWMQSLSSEVSAIETWEENANNLSLLVMSEFDARRQTSHIEEDDVGEIIFNLYDELNEDALNFNEPPGNDYDFPTQDSSWDGVYVESTRIAPEVSLNVIRNAPLKTYLLKRDNQRNVIISEKERKTRRHIGVIDAGMLFQNISLNGNVDPTAVFSYNIGAVSKLAALHDDLSAKLKITWSFLNRDDTFHSKLQQMKESFQNPKQLALDVVALETEGGLTRVELTKQQILHAVELNSILDRQSYLEASHALNDVHAERVIIAEREYKAVRESYLDHTGASLDAILAYFASLDDMKSIYSSLSRELLEMIEETAIESNVAQEMIHAEAEIERENEFVSINQIEEIGHARIQETKEFIENVFWNLARCFHHAVSTSTGRKQFVFYIGLAASLVLVVSTLKEIISLTCAFLLRLCITPRLVREYGNLRFSMRRSSEAQTQTNSIILPTKIKARIEQASKTASFARKRRLPLRNILLHGKPGCGKSVTAKAIAQSIPNLPYALMSGSDIFPLGNQGPSELRRLLSWANKCGAVIIIDEAECAVGKRGKVLQDDDQQQQQDFSRDCLNVLLSLTGTMGNIMLILTTTNPGELDEAVLDRMDEIIHLPSLSSTERTCLLQNHFSRLFELAPEQPSSSIDRMLRVFRRSTNKACYDSMFDVTRSISSLSNTADLDTFSGRELEKLLQGVAYKTYASDTGVLSQSLWDVETRKLMTSFAAKQKGRSIEASGSLRRTVNKHEIGTVKAQKRNKIKYKPDVLPFSDDEDDENSLGFNEYLLGRHVKKLSKTKRRNTQAGETPDRTVITRSVSKMRHQRKPLEDITPTRVFESSC